MKVFNLTDVSTPQLRRQGLAGVPIRVTDKTGNTVIQPGTHAEVRDLPATRKYLQQNFVLRGAVAMDRLPKDYTGTAGTKKAKQPAPLSAASVQTRFIPPPPSETPEPAPEDDAPPDTQPVPGAYDGGKKKRSSRRGN